MVRQLFHVKNICTNNKNKHVQMDVETFGHNYKVDF